jgi:hypothetical protein
MKYMNNHFGQSRIFGRARFMAEPAGDIGNLLPSSANGEDLGNHFHIPSFLPRSPRLVKRYVSPHHLTKHPSNTDGRAPYHAPSF